MVDFAVKPRRYAIVIVTYGEVEKLAVRTLWPSSRKIVQVVTRQIVRLPRALIYVLADYRSAKHYIDWQRNRYRSRLVPINRAQTEGIARELRRYEGTETAGASIDVVDAYYFVPPYLEDVLEEFRRSRDGVIVVPMIPVESSFSCGVACQMAIDAYGAALPGKVRVMHGLWKDELLHRIYLDHIFGSLSDEMRRSQVSKLGLVMVIHGTIVRDRKGRPPSVFTGLEETHEFFRIMRDKILADPRNVFGEVKQGCLNHKAGGEWTSETIEKALEEFREEGYEAIAMFPYGYFADNSETDYESKKLLEASGIPLTQYIPCINASPDFFSWLASKIVVEIKQLARQQEFFYPDEMSEQPKHINGKAL